jgi:uncharacterized membrane protein
VTRQASSLTDERFDELLGRVLKTAILVVFSVIGFWRQRDWLFVGVTLTVLALLAYSLTTG